MPERLRSSSTIRAVTAAAVTVTGACVIFSCLFAVYLGGADWGDGRGDKLTTAERVLLIALAVAAAIATVLTARRLTRRTP